MATKKIASATPSAAVQVSVAIEQRAVAEQTYWWERFEALREQGGCRRVVESISTIGADRLANELLALPNPPTWMDKSKVALGDEDDLHLSEAAQAAQQIADADAAFAAHFAVEAIEQRDRIKAETLFLERIGIHPDDARADALVGPLAGVAWIATQRTGAAAELARRARVRGDNELAARYEAMAMEMADLVRVVLKAILEVDADGAGEAGVAPSSGCDWPSMSDQQVFGGGTRGGIC